MPLSQQQLLNMKMKRNRIVESATYLFATEGYEGTTIKKIAEASGISFGSVFTYFKDKDELFYTVVTEPLKNLTNNILTFNPRAENTMTELEQMIKNHIQIFAGMNIYLTLVVQVIAQYKKYPDVFEELDKFHDVFREKVSLLVQYGQSKGILIQQDSLTVSTLYVSLLVGIRVNATDDRYSDMWERYAASAINLFGPIKQ